MEHRPYQPNESSTIEGLFLKTFTDSEGESEGHVISQLVSNLMSATPKSDLYGFVSTDANELVGAIFLSRLSFEDDTNAFLLSPVAVHSAYQGKGIGQSLISYGLQVLKQDAIDLVITYGDPAFYSKVGFSALSEEVIKAPFKLSQPEGWLGQSLAGEEIQPTSNLCKCVKAFDNPAYW